MDERKILILVEGEKTDYRLMERLLSVYGISDRHRIVAYHTNIYTLYREMFMDGEPDSHDLLLILKAREPDVQKKAMFDDRYSDILLIFDLDPQDSQFSSDKISEMAAYFTESTEMGKLYLNYPMVEAFYHMETIPDPAFNSRTVTMAELKSRTYKSRVNLESYGHDYTKFAATRKDCNIVITSNIRKANWLVFHDTSGESMIPPEGEDILRAELALLGKQDQISVLCTCAFYIADYNAKLLTEEEE